MTKPNPLFSTKNPRLVTRERLQFITRIDVGLSAGTLRLFGLAVLILFAESGLFEGGDVFGGNCDGGWLSAEHCESCLSGMDGFSGRVVGRL